MGVFPGAVVPYALPEVSYFVAGVICASVLIPGVVSYAYLSALGTRPDRATVALVALVSFLVALARSWSVGLGVFGGSLRLAVILNLFYELLLLTYLPLIPTLMVVFLPHVAGLHRQVAAVGGVLAALFGLVAVLLPDLYQSVQNLFLGVDPSAFGRGPKGPIYYAAQIALLLCVFYGMVAMVIAGIQGRLRGAERTLTGGLVFASAIVLAEFYAVFSGSYPLGGGTGSFSRLLVALSVFSLSAVVATTQRALAGEQDARSLAFQLAAERDLLEQTAFTDEMTGLPNRQALLRDLEGAESGLCSLLFLDLDNLSDVNALHGYDAGDQVVLMTASILSESCPPGGRAYRLNADTFAIAVRETPAESFILARHLLRRIRDLRLPGTSTGQFSAAIGLAERDGEASGTQEWINSVGRALQLAKRGEEPVVLYNPELHQAEIRRRKIIAALSSDPKASGMSVVYQPLLTSNELTVGAEALIRWRHPELGVIGPSEFIPLAEASSLVARITDFVLAEVVGCIRENLLGLGEFPIAVNLSGRDLADPRLLERVRRATASIEPRQLAFEITESELIRDFDTSLRNLRRLREAGHQVSLDDFGTGYSSLSYLNELPIDKLKIDRSFVQGIPEAAQKIRLLDAILMATRQLGLETVIEGVEARPQLNYLIGRGCRLFQGYLFSGPLSPQEFGARILQTAPPA